MKPSILLTFFLGVLSIELTAQTYVDLMRIDHNQGLSQSYDDASNSTARFDETTFDGLAPIVLDSSNVLITGVNLEHTTVSQSPNSFTEIYGLILKLGYSRKFSDKFTGTFIALPKLSSDLKNVNGDHVQIGGVALFKLKKSQHFSYKFGLYSNSDLFGPMVVPIVGFYYRKEKWEANFTLPISAWMSYDLGESTKLGAKFQGINKSYLLNNGTPTYMEKINNEVSLYLQQGFGKWHLILAGGHTIGRSGKFYDTNDKLGVALSAVKLDNNRTPLNDR
ncbi:MAG: hypothetical protein HON12_03160, partial [Flavobacteriales bacterium]|nr:hypothetical protein [Flavobacteriales bacterium]